MSNLPNSILASNRITAVLLPCPMKTLVHNIKPLVKSRKHTELKSAAKKFCNVAGHDFDSWIVYSLQDVISPMHEVIPAVAQIEASHWTTTCSKVSLLFRLNGFQFLSGHCKTELPSEWVVPVQRARACHPEHLRGLMPFLRSCIFKGLRIQDITQSTYEKRCHEIDRTSRRKNKKGSKKAIRRAWNACVQNVEDWPQVMFTIEDTRNRYMLPKDSMPPAVAAFDAKVHLPIRPKKKYGRRGGRLRAATILSRKYSFRRIVSAAIKAGINPARLETEADVCQLEVLAAAFNGILERGGKEITADVSRLSRLMLGVAEHWVGTSGAELEAHYKFHEDFKHVQKGMAEKNQRLLSKFDNDKVITHFLTTPARVMARYKDVANDALGENDWVQMQLATVMSLLIRVLIRMENLKQIRWRVHLTESGFGADRQLSLCFGEDETKTEEFLDTVLPRRLIKILDTYMQRAWGPLKRGEESDFLFPGYGGKHKSASCLGPQLSDFIKKETGIRVTPHQFRHLGGYFHLRRHPGDYASVQKMLGHSRVETTVRYYTGTMERAAAFKTYNAAIEDIIEAAEAANASTTKLRINDYV